MAQWHVRGTFHNITAFLICTINMWIYKMGMWILHNGRVEFEQLWLGQVEKEDCEL